ncbi:MAG: hypothetical protein ACOC0N_00815, partial [Chroococcales cyanobacterium]
LNYEPSVYEGKITLFRANEIAFEGYSFSDEVSKQFKHQGLGWSEFSTEAIETYQILGNHNTILSEPNVQQLAKQLNCILERIQNS